MTSMHIESRPNKGSDADAINSTSNGEDDGLDKHENKLPGTKEDKTPPSKAEEKRNITNLYVSSVSYLILTFTDGALRAIVLLYLVSLRFSAVTLAIMFSLYELVGVGMNFGGGIIGANYGMRFLVVSSTVGQIVCVALLIPLNYVFPTLSAESSSSTIIAATAYISIAQIFSGISKDLMKIQGKSVPKLVTKSEGEDDRLFKIVSVVTGFKNSFKGFGYLIGSLLLWGAGWIGALVVQMVLVLVIVPFAMRYMESDLGISEKAKEHAKIRLSAFKKGWNVNVLSSARFFLFGSRDVWFEVAAPYFFRSVLGWAPFSVGAFMAGYTIIYGQLQASTSQIFSETKCLKRNPNNKDVTVWAVLNFVEILALGLGAYYAYRNYIATGNSTAVVVVLLVGIAIFAVLFAVSSAVHSFLIVNFSNRDKVSMDVGFYYMSNAGGRLVGTLISGFIYDATVQEYGLAVNLWVAAGFMFISALISTKLRPPIPKTAAIKNDHATVGVDSSPKEEEKAVILV